MGSPPLDELNERSREVFRLVVESYLETGEPVGSRTLTRQFSQSISAATIRNVMQDLELLGLVGSPHVSAGRMPTELGLRMFVDGLMEVADVTMPDRTEIESTLANTDQDISRTLDKAGDMLSVLTKGASVVLSPAAQEAPIKHLEFVSLSPDRVLCVLVLANGQVENRLMTPPQGMTPSAMREAANFLNSLLEGRTISEMRSVVAEEVAKRRHEIDALSQQLIEAGAAQWIGSSSDSDRLIVRGRSNLIAQGVGEEDFERIRQLFDDLEKKEGLVQLLDQTERGEGVRIFIGSENKLFSLSGSTLVVSPYMNAERKIVGAVGVIGPTRLNYGRVVPIVDYTAQLVGKILSDR